MFFDDRSDMVTNPSENTIAPAASMFRGNAPTGAGQTQFHSAGLAVFPTPKIVLKATYQHVKNNDPVGALSDSFLGAVGFFF